MKKCNKRMLSDWFSAALQTNRKCGRYILLKKELKVTTGEWLAIVIGSNSFTLAASVFISHLMIKSKEDKAKEADRLRDATIESLGTRSTNLENDITTLNRRVETLSSELNEVTSKLNVSNSDIAKLKMDVSRLKRVVLRQKSLSSKYRSTILQQDSRLEKLEGTILSIANNLMRKKSLDRSDLLKVNSDLKMAQNSILEVQRAIKELEKDVYRNLVDLDY